MIEAIRSEISRGRNIRAVARGAKVHPNAIYRLMGGKTSPRQETLKRLAAYLGLAETEGAGRG